MKGTEQGCNNIWHYQPNLDKVHSLYIMGNLDTPSPTGRFALMSSSKQPYGMAMKLCPSVQNLVISILK